MLFGDTDEVNLDRIRRDLNERLAYLDELHPLPWRMEPHASGQGWVVRDALGGPVASRLSEPMAEMIVGFVELSGALQELGTAADLETDDTGDGA